MHGITAREPEVTNYLQTYFHEISQTPLLTAVEECDLAEAIARNDHGARTRMIEANLRLVVRIARDYLNRGLCFEDLIAEGNLGLIRAVSEFDPRFKTRFSTYASYWIKQSIRQALINTAPTIRLPVHMHGLLNLWRRTERKLARERGFAPSFEEVASSLGLTELQKNLVRKAERASQLKLESSLGDEDRSWTADHTMDAMEGPEASLEQSDDHEEILKRMNRLNERERMVITLRYGLDGELPLKLREIGRRLGVTREWVRKIELRAVSKLREVETTPTTSTRTRTRRGRPSRTCVPRAASAAVSARPGSSAFATSLRLQAREAQVHSIAAAG